MARRRQRALIDRDAREAMLRSLMANVPGAIYRSAWHDDYALELISDEIERISGYPASDFIGADARRTIMSIICSEDRDAVLEMAQNAVDDGRPFVLEYRIERADGELRWVLDRGHRVRGPRGEEWMDGAIFDITERRANEEALRRHEVERARVEELRASQARIIEAADAARRRIERDLHDGAQQHLVALALEVRMAQARAERDPASAVAFLRRVGEGLARASAELRELAHGIHPAVLTERGLGAAVQALAGRASVPVEVLETPADRLPAAIEAAAYFVVAEALTNVAKYAQASAATVAVTAARDRLVVEVSDDGVGGATPDSGSGLRGLADRVGALDGTLTVASPPGEGTRLRAVIPLGAR
jgi:PAS domain S-box-containing protein